ncbi:MAG: hypothetical protein KGJ02_06270 [Verrucomicrobiota bacterium]|nr:hypothetical protein [Verrucomicrobiota bacterium]
MSAERRLQNAELKIEKTPVFQFCILRSAFCIFLLPLAAFATVNEPLHMELQTGYRNDNLHWHLQDAGDGGVLYSSEKYKNLQFWDNALDFRMIYRDLVFYVYGDYAAFGRGQLKQRLAYQPYATDQAYLNFSVNGWAADWDTYFGLAVNLTDGRTYKFLVIPLVGYSGNYEVIDRPGSQTWTSSNAVGGTSYQVVSSFPSSLRQSWNGVYLGVGIEFDPVTRMTLNAGYAYHWIHLDFKTEFQEEITLYNPGITSQYIQLNSINSSSGGNLAHSGWAQIDYRIDRAWRVGARATVQYCVTSVLAVTQEQTTTHLVPASATTTTNLEQKLKLRWTPVTAVFTVSRTF